MPKGAGCCVPLCTSKSNNSSDVTFYRVPSEKSIRQQYYRLLCKKKTSGSVLKNHLPSIFPWRKEKCGGIKNTGIPLTDITNIDSKRRKVV